MKTSFVDIVKEYAIITLGVLLVAIGLQYFLSPNQIAAGGLSGMALIVNHFVPELTVGTVLFIGNLVLYVISFLVIGRDFGFKTIYASFGLSVAMDGLAAMTGPIAVTRNPLFAALGGTVFVIIGLSVVFARNASTGGTDILAKILTKYTTLNIGIALFCVDLFVTLSGGIVFGMNKGLYALLAVVLNGIFIDRLIALLTKNKDVQGIQEA
ncbi:MAG: YitT family protein [Clostridium sp.]